MIECDDIYMNVIWTGLINKEKLYELYTIADMGIMPSFHEQCSYVAIEMMMHGLPIIGSTSTGLYEMIENNITGLHIPVMEYADKQKLIVHYWLKRCYTYSNIRLKPSKWGKTGVESISTTIL